MYNSYVNWLEFKEELKKINLDLSEIQLEQFKLYSKILLTENAKYNLTALTSEEDIILLHFFDSLQILKHIKPQGSLIDIGTGAGFPGIPLKILVPELNVTLCDSTLKKISFLDQVIEALHLQNIQTLYSRAEDIKLKYDYVVSRAVAPLPILLELTIPLANVSGLVICYKGQKAERELEESQNAIKVLNGRITLIDKFFLYNETINRTNIFIEKTDQSPIKYPRMFSKIKKDPL
jgi:16S rRNA (guanine527-N7)-methyltransferase